MRIGVFGSGAVGGNFGGRLALAGEDVVFIARGDHLQAMKQEGLRLSGSVEAVIRSVDATDDPAQVGVVDVVLMGVKSWQVVEAARAMRPMVGEHTMVVPLQNGMEAPDELASVFGTGPVVGGLCATVSRLVEPGHVHVGGGSVTLGELDNRQSDRVDRFLAVLQKCGINANVPEDIHAAMWCKFAMITAWGGIGALSRSPAGVWGSQPESRELFERAVHETLNIAAARGVAVGESDTQHVLGLPDRLAPGATASMQRDIDEGRPSELAYQNGAVVRYARDVGVATPVHDMIYGCLVPLERRAREQIRFPEG